MGAGFVTIIGRPNAGKSTLMNAILGQQLSIVTEKAQTTRKRVLGILSEPDHQVCGRAASCGWWVGGWGTVRSMCCSCPDSPLTFSFSDLFDACHLHHPTVVRPPWL